MNRKTCTILPPIDIAAFAQATGALFVDMDSNADIERAINESLALATSKNTVFVRVNIDYSKKTQFTSGAVKTNFGTFDMATKLRLAGRAIYRKFTG